MQFHFPDSGRDVEVKNLSFLTLSLLRSQYEATFPGKPVVPVKEIKDGDEVVDRVDDKENPEYKKAYTEWFTKMSRARWLGTKVLYANAVQAIDQEAVNNLVDETYVLTGIDLRKAIPEGYKEANVRFNTDLLDKYIYLFHLCISNSAEQTLFEDAMMSGSAPTQEEVQTALFRARG